jgi:hypothetical protein
VGGMEGVGVRLMVWDVPWATEWGVTVVSW